MSNSAKSSSFRAAAKGPKVKARLYYHTEETFRELLNNPGVAGAYMEADNHNNEGGSPYYLVPADDAAYDQMVEQMAERRYNSCAKGRGYCFRWKNARQDERDNWTQYAKDDLASIGIRRSTKGGK